MFDVIFSDALLLKKIFNALNDVLKEVNLECSGESIQVMGMDASHVALVQLFINADTEGPIFKNYRCDKQMTLSFKVETVQKILKTLGNDDTVQLIVEDDSNTCKFVCKNEILDRTATFNVNLLELESEHLGVPDADYESEVQMPSNEFAKMMRDLSIHGESLQLGLQKEALTFQVKGDEASMELLIKERRPRSEIEAEKDLEAAEKGIKDEASPEEKTEETAAVEDGEKEDVDMDGEAEGQESLVEVKKGRKAKAKSKLPLGDEVKGDAKEGEDPNLTRVAFKVSEPVSTIYSLRYMSMFAKAAPLANYVKLSVSGEQPIIVKFPLRDEEHGHLSFYLAPKIDE